MLLPAATCISPFPFIRGHSLAVYYGICVSVKDFILASDSRPSPNDLSHTLSCLNLHGSARSALIASAAPWLGVVGRRPISVSSICCSAEESLLNPTDRHSFFCLTQMTDVATLTPVLHQMVTHRQMADRRSVIYYVGMCEHQANHHIL